MGQLQGNDTLDSEKKMAVIIKYTSVLLAFKSKSLALDSDGRLLYGMCLVASIRSLASAEGMHAYGQSSEYKSLGEALLLEYNTFRGK